MKCVSDKARTVCECMPVLWHIVLLQTLDISNITSLIMATISAGCSIKPNADGNYSGLQFSHYYVLLDMVPVLLVIGFFSPATPQHYKLLPACLNIKAAAISYNNGDGQSRQSCM